MKNFTFTDYRRRLRRATQLMSTYAADQMAGKSGVRLSLAEVAEAACWSPEHFSRVWLQTTGETPLTSVRRSLLELSKQALLEGQSISVVAERAAYASGQSFAHAFQRQFGHSASCFVAAARKKCPRPDFRLVALEEPITLLTATYSGGSSDAGEFSSACMTELQPVLARRANGYFFLMNDLLTPNASPSKHSEFTFGLSEKHKTTPNGHFDRSSLRTGAYACFSGVTFPDDGTLDAALARGGWRRTDGPLIERLLTDRALTPEPLRKEYLWVPIAR